MQKRLESPTFQTIAAIALTLTGAGMLLKSLGLLDVGAIFWVVALLLVAVFLLSRFASAGDHWGSLILGLGALAQAATLATRSWQPINEPLHTWSGLAALVMFVSVFCVLYMRQMRAWQPLVPILVLLLMALAIALAFSQNLQIDMTGSVLTVGMALAFIAVRLGARTPASRWDLLQSALLAMLGIVAASLLVQVQLYLWPIVMLVAGLVFLARPIANSQRRRKQLEGSQ